MTTIENPNEFNDMINHMPENIRIIEDQIDVEVQQEYLELARNLKEERMDEDEAISRLPVLLDPDADLLQRKETIVQLAQTASVRSFRELENFSETADGEIAEFARFGVHIARAMLESDLSDDNIGFISSGLGGKGNLLRYFFCIFNLEEKKAFLPSQKKIIKKEFDLAFRSENGEMEKINFKGEYAIFQVLAPLQCDFNELIRQTLDEINEFGQFLYEGYFATNVKIPDHKEISSIINEIRNRKDEDENEETEA